MHPSSDRHAYASPLANCQYLVLSALPVQSSRLVGTMTAQRYPNRPNVSGGMHRLVSEFRAIGAIVTNRSDPGDAGDISSLDHRFALD